MKATTGRSYNITGPDDRIRPDILRWLEQSPLVRAEDYTILNNGFLIDDYSLHFHNEHAELLYLLVWK